MYFIERIPTPRHFLRKCFLPFIPVLVVLFFGMSCQKDPDLDENDDPVQVDPGDPINQADSDKISEFLVFKEATKITGDLPAATDGQMKMEIEDTIFVVKGYPLGHRIQFKHDPSQKVSGFYIHVGLASYYFDVPKDHVEGQYVPPEESDSISVLILDLDLGTENVDYPFTTEIVIQPHDESGMPVDGFTREITVEDPEDKDGICNDIRRPPVDTFWEWDFTIRAYNGNILNVLAPGLATPINSQGAGCCGDNGNSYTTSNSPSCVPNVSGNGMTWVELAVDDYSVRTFELLWFWDDGRLDVFGNHVKKQYDRATTNFCTKQIGYQFSDDNYGFKDNFGTHDFTPGASQINLDLTNWVGGYRLPQSADLVYTCNTLMMSWGNEDNFTSVYRKWKYDPNIDPTGFHELWKLWFD